MEKEIIFVLGGGIVQDGSEWRTTFFQEEGDKFGALGDRLRVAAAASLFSKNPNQTLIVSGGKGQLRDNPNAPTVASVIKHELVELGVPEKKLQEEEQSNNTFEQLQKLKNLVILNNWQKVYILTNTWHILRVNAFLERDGALCEFLSKGKIETVSAEDVLIESDPEKWKEMIDVAYTSESMEKRIALEKKGVEDIRGGRYKVK